MNFLLHISTFLQICRNPFFKKILLANHAAGSLLNLVLLDHRYTYLKKLIEEAHSQEDTKKLLQFCSWENPTFSHAVLLELLWQVFEQTHATIHY